MKAWVKDPQGKYHMLPNTLDGDILVRFSDGEVGFDCTKYVGIRPARDDALFREWTNSALFKNLNSHSGYFKYERITKRVLLNWDKFK